MRKKIFLIGIAVLLLLSSFSTYIFADDVEEKTIEFLINEEEIKEGYNNFVEMNIDIPSGLFEKDIELYKLQKKQKKKVETEWERVEDTYTATIPFSEDGRYRVEVVLPGKEKTYLSSEFVIDQQKPTLIFKAGNKEFESLPDFVNKKEKIEISFQDKNLKKETTSISIDKDGEVIYSEQGKRHYDYNLKEEGTYVFHDYGEDKAGNSITYSNEDFPLHVDFKKPVYRFSDGINVISKNTVFYAQQDIYVEVEDLNFQKDKSKVYVNEQELAGEWIKKENLWVMKIPCSTSGKYTLGVYLEDHAGNVVENLKALQFELDTLFPEVEVRLNDTNIDHASNYYNEEQRLNFIVKENHLNKDKSAVMVNGKKLPWKKTEGG